jgi:hypothetical protein
MIATELSIIGEDVEEVKVFANPEMIIKLSEVEIAHKKLEELKKWYAYKNCVELFTEIQSRLNDYHTILISINSIEGISEYLYENYNLSFIILIYFLFDKVSELDFLLKNSSIEIKEFNKMIAKFEGGVQCNHLAICYLLDGTNYWNFFNSLSSLQFSNENSVIFISDTFRGLFLLDVYNVFVETMMNKKLEFDPKRTFNHFTRINEKKGQHLALYLAVNKFTKDEEQERDVNEYLLNQKLKK